MDDILGAPSSGLIVDAVRVQLDGNGLPQLVESERLHRKREPGQCPLEDWLIWLRDLRQDSVVYLIEPFWQGCYCLLDLLYCAHPGYGIQLALGPAKPGRR